MTKGYLVFRDLVVLGFVIAIVFAGLTTVSSLREDDCLTANAARANAMEVALADVASDRNIWLAIDELVEGIPEPARSIIFAELETRETKIAVTYEARPCP